jgi:3-isopropylmalate dehydrogenase
VKEKRIAVIPGDGIGIDVTREALAVLATLRDVTGAALVVQEFDFGAERYLKTGVSLPEGTYEMFQRDFDAIYIGALGDPRVPDMTHARDILLGTRFVLDLYANHRPVKLLHDDLCPLKGRGRKDVNFVVFRENTEGSYVGMGGIFKKGTPDEIATQEDINTRKGVERIIEHAFRHARANGLTKVTMSDKSNALRFGHDLWQRVFAEVSKRYPEIQANHLYIDALALQMIKNPAQFQVVVTCNMFGDIVTDLGAALQGGLGMAASGNINPQGVSMFEPVHGSAPKYAGKNVANPFGAILSAQMMLDHLGFRDEAVLVEKAVVAAIERGETPRELGGSLGTREVGEAVSRRIREMG